MRTKRKWLLMAGSLALLVLLVAAVAGLYGEIRKMKRVHEQLLQAKGELDRLYARNPFPSATNIVEEQANLDTMRGELADMLGDLSAEQVNPPTNALTEFQFMDHLANARRLLQAKAREHGVAVAKDAYFGFGQYQGGRPPTTNHVPRLLQQVQIVEGLCVLMFESKISALNGVLREEFEGNPLAGSAGDSLMRTPAGAAQAPDMSAQVANAGNIQEGQLHGVWHFTFDITAREVAWQEVLNRLARYPAFCTVTRFEAINSEKYGVREALVEEPVGAAGAEVDETAATPGKHEKKVLPRDQRIMTGRDVPMNIKLDVEVYQFRRPSA